MAKKKKKVTRKRRTRAQMLRDAKRHRARQRKRRSLYNRKSNCPYGRVKSGYRKGKCRTQRVVKHKKTKAQKRKTAAKSARTKAYYKAQRSKTWYCFQTHCGQECFESREKAVSSQKNWPHSSAHISVKTGYKSDPSWCD